jgi:hypothetical protein
MLPSTVVACGRTASKSDHLMRCKIHGSEVVWLRRPFTESKVLACIDSRALSRRGLSNDYPAQSWRKKAYRDGNATVGTACCEVRLLPPPAFLFAAPNVNTLLLLSTQRVNADALRSIAVWICNQRSDSSPARQSSGSR